VATVIIKTIIIIIKPTSVIVRPVLAPTFKVGIWIILGTLQNLGRRGGGSRSKTQAKVQSVCRASSLESATTLDQEDQEPLSATTWTFWRSFGITSTTGLETVIKLRKFKRFTIIKWRSSRQCCINSSRRRLWVRLTTIKITRTKPRLERLTTTCSINEIINKRVTQFKSSWPMLPILFKMELEPSNQARPKSRWRARLQILLLRSLTR